jgi:iron complex transport system permease protein
MTNLNLEMPYQSKQTTLPSLNLGIRWWPILVMALALIGAFLLVVTLGSVNIPLEDVLRVILGGEASKASWTTIIVHFRLPKAITAILAGAGLGLAGLMMQSFFRNPLAEPFVLGVSSGASLGVALVVLAAGTVGGVVLAGLGFLGDLAMASAAGIGAALALLIVLLAARALRSTMTLLIMGMMLSYFTSAFVSLLMYFAIPERIQAYINWTFGSFGGTTWSQLAIFAPMICLGIISTLGLSKTLNALLLGEEYARSMGLNINQARWAILGTTALLAGAVTAFCGPIGFIGTAVPHICRAILGTSDHRSLVPATIFMGGIIALVAALIAEWPFSAIVLPLNAVTSLLGVPVVIWVLLRRQAANRVFS